MTQELARAIIDCEGHLRAGRTAEEGLWQEILDYTWPDRAEITVKKDHGITRNEGLFDSTAPRALEVFGSTISSIANNSSSQWFGFEDRQSRAKSASSEEEKALENTAKQLLDFMEGPVSNLYTALHTHWLETGALGTSCIYADKVGSFLRLANIPLADIVFEEDIFGYPTAKYRQHDFTEHQALSFFGEDALAKEDGRRPKLGKEQKTVRFIHAVMPAAPDVYYTASKFPRELIRERGAEYLTAWVNTETSRVFYMRAQGTSPYCVSRWYRPKRSVYGRSPAMNALPNIRMANRMLATILRGGEKLVDPAWYIRDGSLLSPLRIFPGGMTFGDGPPPEPLVPPGASRIEMGVALLQQVQQAIEKAFFAPLFMSPESPVRTATEVLQHADERSRVLAPMITRQQDELFNPLLARCYDLGVRAGAVTPLSTPDGRGIKPKYRNPLEAAQLQAEALGVARLGEGLAFWVQADPTIFDDYATSRISQIIHAGSGAPWSIRATPAEKRRKQEARAAEQQAAAAAQQGAQIIDAVEAGAKVQAAQR